MKKIATANWVSVDGFFAGPNGEIDPQPRDPAKKWRGIHIHGWRFHWPVYADIVYQIT